MKRVVLAALALLLFPATAVQSDAQQGSSATACEPISTCLETVQHRYDSARRLLVQVKLPTDSIWRRVTGDTLQTQLPELACRVDTLPGVGAWYQLLRQNVTRLALLLESMEGDYERLASDRPTSPDTLSPFALRVAQSVDVRLTGISNASRRASIGQSFGFLYEEWTALRTAWTANYADKLQCVETGPGTTKDSLREVRNPVDELQLRVDSLRATSDRTLSLVTRLDSLLRASPTRRLDPPVGLALAGYVRGAVGAGLVLRPLPFRHSRSLLTSVDVLLGSAPASSSPTYRPGLQWLVGGGFRGIVVMAGPAVRAHEKPSVSTTLLVRAWLDTAWGLAYDSSGRWGARVMLLPGSP